MDRGILEAAQAMGCSTLQIICKVLLPECLPSLLTGFTTASITILSYGAMAGIIGGGGVGAIAINYGYYRTKYLVTYVAVIILIIMVQIFQSAGGRLATRLDKRITKAPRKQKDRRKAGPGDSG
jgi:D-methionine transport system permease protein